MNDLTAVLARLGELEEKVSLLSGQLADTQLKVALDDDEDDDDEDEAKPGRMPRPTPQWHRLSEEERAAELGKLRGFLREFGPLYGHMLRLGKCWQQHPLAVMAIEIWGELHMLLFLGQRRKPSVLSGQAEALIRVVPGLLQLADRETRNCDKHRAPIAVNGNTGGVQ
jgi:hypothetical protein